MPNYRKAFEEFDSEDDKVYQKRLLIWVLEMKLAQKGELKPEDIPEAYKQCQMLIHQDLEFVAKKWCLLCNPGELIVDPYRCCLTQLDDAVDLKRDAIELAHNMKPYIFLLIYRQPEDKRLKVRNDWRIVLIMRLECVEIGDISTFLGLFQELLGEMTAIDEKLSGEDEKLKPVFESFFREVAPTIVSKLKKYYAHPRLGYEECQFCKSRWVQKSNEPERNLSNLRCFKTPQELEKFLVLSFRRTFYAELLQFITYMDMDL